MRFTGGGNGEGALHVGAWGGGAGKGAGMTVWAVEDAYSSGVRAKKEALADAFIESYEEIDLGD